MELNIGDEPSGMLYQAFINSLGEQCPAFSLVVRADVKHAEALDLCLFQLEEAKIAEERVSEWPGTRLLAGTAQLVRYAADARSLATLLRVADRLYSWQHPALPEDLAFYYPDGGVALQTTAHERDGAVFSREPTWWLERFAFLAAA